MFNSYGIPKWKLWLFKAIDNNLYQAIKHHLITQRNTTRWARPGDCSFSPANAVQDRMLSFKHSGNAGDIIYALPTIKALNGIHGAHLSLALGMPLSGSTLHPLGGVMLNQQMYDNLSPLLLQQNYISKLSIYHNNDIDFDLDLFRKLPVPFDRTNISRWYFNLLGITADLSIPWLTVNKNDYYSDFTILARSSRYRNENINYKFLSGRKRLVFVGIKEEFEEMRKIIPGLDWHPVKNFLELGETIAGCQLFIGNQSFPFSLAEGLKVPRILEVDPRCANVMPCGNNGFEAFSQTQLEYLVEKVLGNH